MVERCPVVSEVSLDLSDAHVCFTQVDLNSDWGVTAGFEHSQSVVVVSESFLGVVSEVFGAGDINQSATGVLPF